MLLLNYFRVGSTELWPGIPLRVVVRMDRDPQTREFPPVYLGLLSLDMESRKARVVQPSPPFRREADGRHLFELSTVNLPPGSYRIQLYLGHEKPTTAFEELWLLSRSDYGALVEEQCGEEFLPSPEICGGNEVLRFVSELIRTRLRDDCFERDAIGYVNHVEGLVPQGIPDRTFPVAPIEWTAERLVHAFRQLALFGVEQVHWQISLTSKTFGMNVAGKVLEPFTAGLVDYLLDEELGALRTINMLGELTEFKTEFAVSVGGSVFRLHVEHDVDLRSASKGSPSGAPIKSHDLDSLFDLPRLDWRIEPPSIEEG